MKWRASLFAGLCVIFSCTAVVAEDTIDEYVDDAISFAREHCIDPMLEINTIQERWGRSTAYLDLVKDNKTWRLYELDEGNRAFKAIIIDDNHYDFPDFQLHEFGFHRCVVSFTMQEAGDAPGLGVIRAIATEKHLAQSLGLSPTPTPGAIHIRECSVFMWALEERKNLVIGENLDGNLIGQDFLIYMSLDRSDDKLSLTVAHSHSLDACRI